LDLDENNQVEYQKGLAEMLGFFCNPEFHFQRKKAENAEKHVNLQFQSLLERAKAGHDLYEAENEDGPVL
jgi:hypothetical protein